MIKQTIKSETNVKREEIIKRKHGRKRQQRCLTKIYVTIAMSQKHRSRRANLSTNPPGVEMNILQKVFNSAADRRLQRFHLSKDEFIFIKDGPRGINF